MLGMNMKMILALAASLLVAAQAQADVVEASGDHYVLKHEGRSSLSPADLWARLIKPESWWHPDHSYSGDAANLSLEPVAGGLWREEWQGGSVLHGEVLNAVPGQLLRLNAPFGPLQGMGVSVVWTISIKADGDGSLVTFDEIANGTTASKLDALAPAVDGVKSEAMRRLTTIE